MPKSLAETALRSRLGTFLCTTISGFGRSQADGNEAYEAVKPADYSHAPDESKRRRYSSYFPMQKLEKIRPRRSSLLTSPVISPSAFCA